MNDSLITEKRYRVMFKKMSILEIQKLVIGIEQGSDEYPEPAKQDRVKRAAEEYGASNTNTVYSFLGKYRHLIGMNEDELEEEVEKRLDTLSRAAEERHRTRKKNDKIKEIEERRHSVEANPHVHLFKRPSHG